MGQIWLPKKLSKIINETQTIFIGIKGPSGAGKSTAAKIIHEQTPNSIILSGANYQYKATLEDEALSKKVFSRTFNTIQEVLEYYLLNESAELLRNWNIEARPYMSEMYLQDINSLLNQNVIPSPIIAEWVLLNILEDVWGITTHKLSIDALPQKLSSNTLNREGVDNSELRNLSLEEWYNIGEQGVSLSNNDSLETYKKQVKDFYATISEPSKIF